jgi:hypothetical protein
MPAAATVVVRESGSIVTALTSSLMLLPAAVVVQAAFGVVEAASPQGAALGAAALAPSWMPLSIKKYYCKWVENARATPIVFLATASMESVAPALA